MKYLTYAFIVLFLFSLTVGVFPFFGIFSGTPNLLLLFIIALSVEAGDYDYLIISFVSGLFLDFYTGVTVGSFAAGFLILGMGVQSISHKYLVLELNWKYLLGLMTAGYVFVYGFIWLYGSLLSYAGIASATVEFAVLQRKFVPELLYNALFLYPVYGLTEYMREFVARHDRKRYNS